tara:strand:+ start:1201 stop:2364 length:1164 start_codon:yes stop_codon:yes gene_type:complete
MDKITFVIPSRNNLEFLKLAYDSIRKLDTNHEILVLNDASVDGTQEWIDSLNDKDLIVHHNPGPERIGIVGMFDKGIEMARTEIIFAFHADMVAAPNLDKYILDHLEEGTVVSATRVEPPLHPEGPEKIIEDFGSEVEQFDYDKFANWAKQTKFSSGQVTEGIFAPWCMYKKDFLAIGGHDELFAPQSREDSDLFNRFHLAGYKFKQSWDALVYHFTSRGSRFNKYAGGDTKIDSPEWQKTNTKNVRNFVRKWGTIVNHDKYMKPLVAPKYDIGFVIKNCDMNALFELEPWCSTIYADSNNIEYICMEQPNTTYKLSEKILPFDSEKHNDILIEFDASLLTQNLFQNYIMKFPWIIKDSGSIGSAAIEIFIINIQSMNTYEKELIHA